MRTRTPIWIASGALLSSVAAMSACSSSQSEPPAPGPTAAARTVAALPGLGIPHWATPDKYMGRLDASGTVVVVVHLRMRNIDDARTELADVSNPKSARYGQYVSDADFESKYAPTADDVSAVRAHLEAHGLRVTDVPSNRAFIRAEGTAGQIEQAFSTRLGNYSTGTGLRRAPLDAADLPANVASRVAAVMGLSTPGRVKPALVRPIGVKGYAPAAGGSGDAGDAGPTAPTCANYWDEYTNRGEQPLGGGFVYPVPYIMCNGYTPPQVRAAYGFTQAVSSGNDGTGQTVAIIDAWESPTLLQDAQQYATNNDPTYPLASAQFTAQWAPGTPVNDPQQAEGWYGEQSLDVEAVHAIAPKANIAYIAAQSNDDTDLQAALNLVVTNHIASVVSNSWAGYEYGMDQATYTAYEQIILQGTLKGIGFYFASGDDGDYAQQNAAGGTPTGPTVSFPASLPEVTGVGGTSNAINRWNQRVFETGWETGLTLLYPEGYSSTWPPAWLTGGSGGPTPVTDGGAAAWWPAAPGGYYFGSGGGTSIQYAQPWYQAGVVPSSLANAAGEAGVQAWRVVPDVAMLGDPYTGFQVGQTAPTEGGTYGESAVGGTSLATPLFTASIALAQQRAHKAFGAANPLLYLTAKLGSLRDVTPTRRGEALAYPQGILTTFNYRGSENTLVTADGFDNVTGLGVPNGESFLGALGLLGKL